jgi:hypothetical protein
VTGVVSHLKVCLAEEQRAERLNAREPTSAARPSS